MASKPTPLSHSFNPPRILLLALLGGGIIFVGLSLARFISRPSNTTQTTEQTVVVEQKNIAVEIQASGTVEPIQSVNVSPKRPGKLIELRVEQGDFVKKGEILAIMENDEIGAELAQAKANYQEALANLAGAEARIPQEIAEAKGQLQQQQARLGEIEAKLEQIKINIPRNIEEVEATVQDLQARYNLAQLRVKRNEPLLGEGAITQDQFDEYLNEQSRAQATLLEAQKRLENLVQTADSEIKQQKQAVLQVKASVNEAQATVNRLEQTQVTQITQLQAAANSAKANVQRLQVQFNDTIIEAPFDGIVTQRYTTEGAFVTPTTSASNTASATSSSIIALAKGLEVVAKVPEIDLKVLKLNQNATILADAYPDEPFKGVVTRIAPEAVVEQNVTSYEVTVKLLTGQEKLLSKMNVDVTFIGKEINNALVVPTVAIVTYEGKTGVIRLNDEKQAVFTPVEVGLVINNKTQILSGISPDDRIFTRMPKNWQDPNAEKPPKLF